MSMAVDCIDTKAKCRHLKKLTCKGTLRQVFICLITPPPHPPVTHCIRTCTYTHREGGRGERWTREKVRGAKVHKAGSKIPTWLTWLNVSPVRSENTCRKITLQVIFLKWRHFALVSIKLISPWVWPNVHQLMEVRKRREGEVLCIFLYCLIMSLQKTIDAENRKNRYCKLTIIVQFLIFKFTLEYCSVLV
jgi:hypothetical protein